jgi:hypothetical protein
VYPSLARGSSGFPQLLLLVSVNTLDDSMMEAYIYSSIEGVSFGTFDKCQRRSRWMDWS